MFLLKIIFLNNIFKTNALYVMISQKTKLASTNLYYTSCEGKTYRVIPFLKCCCLAISRLRAYIWLNYFRQQSVVIIFCCLYLRRYIN